MASTHVSLITAGGTTNRRIASSLYGYCQTAANTVAKTVSLYTGNSTTADGTWAAGDLFHGLTITVRFRYSNTATNPTLNVNSTGAKRIYKYGTTSPGTTASTSWQANSVISLTYDTLLNTSGCWVMNDHLDDTTGGSGSIEYTLSGSGDDDEYTITATPTTGTATSATIPAATNTDAGVMTAADKTKLTGIASGAEVNVQADWNEADTTSDSYIQNKPTIPTVNDATLTIQKNGTTIDTFTANASSNKTVNVTVPTSTSELTNNSNFVSDASYVHTDNNFTNSDVSKLSGIETGAEVNVQSDWNEADATSDAYILNKPTIPAKVQWFGTCSTAADQQDKVVTTTSTDFALVTGNMVRVMFTYAQTYAGGITLNVDGTGAVAAMRYGTTVTQQYIYRAGEVVDFVYDGTNFVAVNEGVASTTYYGVTKLSDSITSTSTTLAATANSVKTALNTATDITSSVSSTITTGSSVTINSCLQHGKIIDLTMTVSRGASTSAGSNLFQGVLSPSSVHPANWAQTVTFVSSAGIIGQIGSTGQVTARVIGASVSANTNIVLNFIYFTA